MVLRRGETHVVDEQDGKRRRIRLDRVPSDGLSSRSTPVLTFGGRSDGDSLGEEGEEGKEDGDSGEHGELRFGCLVKELVWVGCLVAGLKVG